MALKKHRNAFELRHRHFGRDYEALLASRNPQSSPIGVAIAALLVATASATQDIVIDAFRVESLPVSEQAAGAASCVEANRIAALVSGAGALIVVSDFVNLGLDQQRAYGTAYVVMSTLIVIGLPGSLLAVEPAGKDFLARKSRQVDRVADQQRRSSRLDDS